MLQMKYKKSILTAKYLRREHIGILIHINTQILLISTDFCKISSADNSNPYMDAGTKTLNC